MNEVPTCGRGLHYKRQFIFGYTNMADNNNIGGSKIKSTQKKSER